jgi:hypothetical protein
MAWALWQDKKHRAAKMHVHFDVLRAVPTDVSITAGNGSERDQLRASLDAGGFYVIDRGYRDWAFFQEIVDASASFVGRVQDNTVIHAAEERPLTAATRAAGVVRDVVIKQTGSYSRKLWMASDSGGFFGNFDSIDKLYPLKNLREKKSTV